MGKEDENLSYNTLMSDCELRRLSGLPVPRDSFGDIDDNKLFIKLCKRSLKRLKVKPADNGESQKEGE